MARFNIHCIVLLTNWQPIDKPKKFVRTADNGASGKDTYQAFCKKYTDHPLFPV